MSKIRVDIDELSEKLDEMKADDYATAELEIVDDEDGFDKELIISAVSLEEDEPIGYGVIAETDEELM